MNISVCMIVRNEEQLLTRAVASARDLADEVVIVDTGSEDGTVALAQELGAHVITGADRMHKAQARNLALDAATGDWCVILDADETIADAAGLRAYLETADAQAIYIRCAYVDGKDKHTLSYQQMRIWKRGTYRYQYRAHEVPTPVNGWGKLAYTEFVWQHRLPPGRTWKGDFTLQRLLLDVTDKNAPEGSLIQRLREQYITLSRQYATRLATVRPEYPEMQRLKSELDSATEALHNETQNLIRNAYNDYRTALGKEQSLQRLLVNEKNEAYRAKSDSVLFNSLKIELENRKELLESLSKRKSETDVSSRLKGLEALNVWIVDRADLPLNPASTPHIVRPWSVDTGR